MQIHEGTGWGHNLPQQTQQHGVDASGLKSTLGEGSNLLLYAADIAEWQ